MSLAWLDHVNLRTSSLKPMRHFYTKVLGLEDGPRPDFGFGGAWLYCGTRAAVHLVETKYTPEADDVKLEHFAFRATDVRATIERLEKHKVDYKILARPQMGVLQVNVWDPDGNHIELAFPPVECADLPQADAAD
ncbi:MAG: VOC family protein [Gammaproteobacteria bacterium]|nr:VOC family protein [Gammaproteobacteria bacterium]